MGMDISLLKTSHEELFLDQGHLLALGFFEGWACFRITHREWANLEPWSLGAVAALGNLAAYNEIQDSQSRHYLEPHDEMLIYHSFWGVTPTRARIFMQYPPQSDIGSMLSTNRAITGDVGYIDGDKSPYNGPFSEATELFTVKEKYPQYQVYNPLNDSMYNVMLNFDQRHYRYSIITDKALIKDMLVGNRRVKKYSMGPAWPNTMTLPNWLKKAVGSELLDYSLDVMEGKA
jgi:hypothetical protein